MRQIEMNNSRQREVAKHTFHHLLLSIKQTYITFALNFGGALKNPH